MMDLTFTKMHGLGNDFVVIDGRDTSFRPSADETRAIADRRTGIGCDQLIVLVPPADAGAVIAMRIFNADGGEVEACGNAARCVADLIMTETGLDSAIIETPAGLTRAERAKAGAISVDMGPARLDWRQIPLAEDVDILHLQIAEGELSDPVAIGMGNPHAVFFVEQADAVDLPRLGPLIEHHPLFPMRCNVEVVQCLAPDRLRARVWERGAGLTRACGTGACAALVAASLRGLSARRASVELDGGSLDIKWLGDDHVLMTGPTARVFSGTLDLSSLS